MESVWEQVVWVVRLRGYIPEVLDSNVIWGLDEEVPMSHVDYRKWYCRPVNFRKVPCHPVDFKKTSCRRVDFKKVSCCMSLMPKKGRVAVSILGVYLHS